MPKNDKDKTQEAADKWDKQEAERKKHEAEVDKAGTHDNTYNKDKQWGK